MTRRGRIVAGLVASVITIGMTGCRGSTTTTAPPPTARSALTAAPPTAPQTDSEQARPPVLRVRRLPWHLPNPVGREAILAQGSTLTIAGGLVGSDSSTSSAWRVMVRTGRIEPLAALQVPVHDTAGAVAAGRPTVIGGGNATEQDVVEQWGGHRWAVVGHLPEARSDLVAAEVDGRVIVLGGYNGTRAAEPDILSSRTGRAWRVIGRLKAPVRYAASAVAAGVIWLFGGERSGVEQTAVQRIDPATGHSQAVAYLPHPLGHAVAIPFGSRILIAGGRTGPDTLTNAMWWFDPATDAVTPAGHLPTVLADAAVAEVHGVAYLVGGENPRPTDQVLAITYR